MKVRHFISLVKFSHTIFSLPFAMVGFFLATQNEGNDVSLKLLILVILCVVFARNSAMAFNRYIDRKHDRENPRTQQRELPQGKIKARSALIFAIVNSLLFIITTWFINLLCFYLSPVALGVIYGYSLTKRFTSICHLVLGLGLALAPIGAYLAVAGRFHPVPILISIAVLLWVSGFDIIYALQDEYFDKSNKLRSIPARLGRKGALRISSVLHILTALLLLYSGYLYDFSWIYYTGTALFSLLLFYQHFIVSPRDISKVNIAFFTTNGIASVIYAAFVITDLLLM